MHWQIITVGKPAHPWVKEAVQMYTQRINRYTRMEHVIIKEAARERTEQQMREVCAGAFIVLLDERGKQLRSVETADWIKTAEIAGRKRVCLLIGGADGHSAELRAQAQECWSLSKLTLQHDIALVVLVEQIYRAYSILRGEPYHRE